MLLNNIATYQNLLKREYEDNPAEEKQREVERLYNSSPVIFDYSETYIPEGVYNLEEEQIASPKHSATKKELASSPERKRGAKPDVALTFNPESVQRREEGPTVSLLSALIEEARSQQQDERVEEDTRGKLFLTIYLPDTSSMPVMVKEKSNIREVIMHVLNMHEKTNVEPRLDYGISYELRIHEGDGEPDRDFPALDPEKPLSDFNLDEYCLCEVEALPPTLPTIPTRGSSASRASVSDRGSIGMGRHGSAQTSKSSAPPLPAWSEASMGLSNTYSFVPLAASRRSTFNGSEMGDKGPNPTPRSRDRSNTKQSEDSFHNISVNTVLVVFPDSNQVVVPFADTTRLLDLLPVINKNVPLRLYTNEFCFQVSAADQSRLKSLLGLGPKPIAPPPTSSKGRGRSKNLQGSATKSNFTEAFANAYQEWNVVKKNKFGRKQERVFGVDGKKIYNAKRGQLKGGNHTGVQRAERSINTIVKLEILSADKRTFRITWMDDRDVYNIEYTCETERECAEIVNKINYTRGKSTTK
eukprot:CAMPEP_0173260326 /NCGR_PEP_ID=MMETSP1142-20121109/25512_1 /TAXON_ID=483371 /ORGANISM="non described non described, Strain CCMP2298" /LENGTH=526 /DNA_ID=CAMNT_0014195051 /DNA_START=42 /DNA_END=1623 /DNA_ORIENTATION=+